MKINLSPEQMELIRRCSPASIAQELVDVQPMDPNLFRELRDDPLANALANRFVDSAKGNTNPE
jgi:hypothetical protein